MNVRVAWFVVLAFVAGGGSAGATVLVPADLEELSRDALAIVRGRVSMVDARWTDGRRRIETLVTLDVESTLKGPMSPIARWTVPGGTLGRYRSFLAGAPEFIVGQRVVVFLGGRPPGVPYVLGFGQGVYRVFAVPGGAQLVVIPPPLVAPLVGTVPVVRGDTTRRPLTLAAFEQRVRSLVAAR